MPLEIGKLYTLTEPSDGEVEGRIVRYPTGLPVRLVEETGTNYVVEAPHGETVVFPKRAVWVSAGWTSKEDLLEVTGDEEKLWEFHTNPETGRWYPTKLNIQYGQGYCDWESMLDSDAAVKPILKALVKEHHDAPFGLVGSIAAENPTVSQELVDAICDFTLMSLYGDVQPDWDVETMTYTELDVIGIVARTVELMLTNTYIVKAGSWDLKAGKFAFSGGEVITLEEGGE